MDIIKKADKFAEQAHRGQLRKYTNESYIVHPRAVAKLVASIPHNKAMIAAALLHDVVEDTDITIEDIENEFGAEIRTYVYYLSDVSKGEDGNRKKRKELDRLHIANAPAKAKTIKLADLIDNSKSIFLKDKTGFAKVYLKEKMFLLEVLKEGDQFLWTTANEIVKKYKKILEL